MLSTSVPLCALYPGCNTLRMSCLCQTACSLRSTHLLYNLRSASTNILGRRSPTAQILAVFSLPVLSASAISILESIDLFPSAISILEGIVSIPSVLRVHRMYSLAVQLANV